jgi:hypothetical protein
MACREALVGSKSSQSMQGISASGARYTFKRVSTSREETSRIEHRLRYMTRGDSLAEKQKIGKKLIVGLFSVEVRFTKSG